MVSYCVQVIIHGSICYLASNRTMFVSIVCFLSIGQNIFHIKVTLLSQQWNNTWYLHCWPVLSDNLQNEPSIINLFILRTIEWNLKFKYWGSQRDVKPWRKTSLLLSPFLFPIHAKIRWPLQPRSQGLSSSRQTRLFNRVWREEERPWERGCDRYCGGTHRCTWVKTFTFAQRNLCKLSLAYARRIELLKVLFSGKLLTGTQLWIPLFVCALVR